MSNISSYPLQDNFKTTLSQQWDGATGTVYVASTPSFTFPSGVTTYIVASPGKTTMQIAKINAYDATAKTLTVSDITLKKGASINSTAQTHSVGAEIIISDNYQFWEDIYTAVNSKVDGVVQGFPSYTTTQRDLLSVSNGAHIYNTTTGEENMYIAGAWSAVSSGSTQPNASTTVAGKVEIATTAQSVAGTDTGETGALLSALPSDIAKNTQSGTFIYGADAGGDDTYVVALTPVLTAYTDGQRLTFTPTTTNTGACAVDFGPSSLAIKTKDGNDPQSGVLRALTPVTGTRYGANFVIDAEDFATIANKGIAEMATDAEALAGTDETRYINAKQAKIKTDMISATRDISLTGAVAYAHGLGVAPKYIDVKFAVNNSTSNGVYNSTTGEQCFLAQDVSFVLGIGTTGVLKGALSNNSTYTLGAITAISSTEITITYSNTGSPTGTGTLILSAFA